MALQWFAIQTNPQCERRAQAGLRDRGFTTFLPVETHWKRSRSKQRERVDKPLFTGYLFVGLAPGQSLYAVRLQDGVRGVVLTSDGAPAQIGLAPVINPATGRFFLGEDGKPVKSHLVYDLQARQAAGEFDHTPARRSQFRKGDKARVTLEGPYKGLIGEVMKATDEGRIELMLCAALNWKTTLDADQIEAPEEMPKAA